MSPSEVPRARTDMRQLAAVAAAVVTYGLRLLTLASASAEGVGIMCELRYSTARQGQGGGIPCGLSLPSALRARTLGRSWGVSCARRIWSVGRRRRRRRVRWWDPGSERARADLRCGSGVLRSVSPVADSGCVELACALPRARSVAAARVVFVGDFLFGEVRRGSRVPAVRCAVVEPWVGRAVRAWVRLRRVRARRYQQEDDSSRD